MDLELRLATEDDSPGIIELIDRVFQEYSERVCLEGADADLADLSAHYHAIGAVFWVLVDEAGRVRGTHAAVPPQDAERPGVGTFRRLYLAPELRGSGWGHRLMQIAIDWAIENGWQRIEFWSDVRFHRAHRFFARFGFRSDGRQRTMLDAYVPYDEKFFFLDLPLSG